MTEPYDKAAAGQPITALRWNNLQTAIRDDIAALEANKLNIAGGTVTGTLVVQRPPDGDPNKPTDLVRVRGAGNLGLRLETGTTAADVAALRFFHGEHQTGQISVAVNGRLSFSNALHLLAGRLGVGSDTPQQELHVRGRMLVESGVIQGPGPSIVSTNDLGLYSQLPGTWMRFVTNNGPIRFFADSSIGNTSNVDILPAGDLKVRRFVTAGAGLGVGPGLDTPQDAVHLLAPTGNLGVRMQNGAGPNDWNALRFIHNNVQSAFVGTHGATGRFTVNNVFNLLAGRVGVGPGTENAIGNTFEVRGDLQVGRPGAPAGLLLNTGHTGWSNGVRDRAEISVDSGQKSLMLVGSISAAEDDANFKWPGMGRRVSLWDRLEVNGHIWTQSLVLGPGLGPTFRPSQPITTTGISVEQGIIQRGGPPLAGTSDLGLYSQVSGNWIRIVTTNGGVAFRSDGGIGTVSNVDILPSGDLKVRRWALAGALGIGVDAPNDLAHVKGTGNIGVRIETGATAADAASLRFFHGATQTGFIYTTNAGRLSINDNLYVQGASLGIGTSPNVPLHVRTATGPTTIRIDAGNTASDSARLQFVQGGVQRALLATDTGGLEIASQSLTVDAPTTINSTLTVAAGAAFNSTLTVASGATLNSTLTVTNATTLNSTLTVTAATTLNSSLTVTGGAIIPRLGNSTAAGIHFPSPSASDTDDFAFIRYHTDSGNNTLFRVGVTNNVDDSLRLYQAGRDRIIIQNGTVTIGDDDVPYTTAEPRVLNAKGEIKSYGAGSGLRMSDRAGSAVAVRDWVIYPDGYKLNFWQGEVGSIAVLGKDALNVPRLSVPSGVIQRGGDTITATADLGLYSQVDGNWMRFVTKNGQFSFFSDGGAGSTQIARLDASGNFWVNGRMYADNGFNGVISDRRLKTDVTPLTSSLAKLLEVRGVGFRWLDESRGKSPQIGLIAQDVEAVFPELVSEGDDGFKRLDYTGLVAPLIEAVREQQQQIAGLRRELAELRERIA